MKRGRCFFGGWRLGVDLAGVGLSEENRKIFYESLALIGKNLKNLYDSYGEK